MKVQVIIGSTRPGRVTDRLAKWVVNEAKQLSDTDVELVDLADYVLPFLDEPISPQYNPERKPNPVAKRWIDTLSKADAFILVTPEYNRSTSGVLKNALDYIDYQFDKKPVALVGHGSTGGAQAIGQLRAIIPGLLSITVPAATYFQGAVKDKINEQGTLIDGSDKESPSGSTAAIHRTLDQLKWYSDALSVAREKE